MSDRLGAAWREYRTKVIPLEAPAIQAQESRRAFYAGAQALLGLLLNVMEPGTELTAADLKVMDEIAAELTAFSQAVREGRA